jgi:hypothetical protein
LPDGIFTYQKVPIWVKFWSAWDWKMLVCTYFSGIWCVLWPFGVFCGYLLHFSSLGIKNLATLGRSIATNFCAPIYFECRRSSLFWRKKSLF